MKKQNGFTLIELITVIGIIGVLAGISIYTFKEYKSKAAYAVAGDTLRGARVALESGRTEVSNVIPALEVSQSTPGQMVDAQLRALVPLFQLPKNIKFTAFHDPDCSDAGCIVDSFEVKHCAGLQYTSWTRFGDGVDVIEENIDGAGCA